MKHKLLTAIALSIASFTSQAQNAATPNPGFESWATVGNYQDPVDWHTLNASTAIVGVYTCTKATGVDVHSGSAAVKLTTKSIFGIKANGFISTATPITSPPYGVTGGIPYSGRPDSIVGWYKNTTLAGDTAFLEFYLKDTVSGLQIGWATFNITSNHATYQRFSAPITYYSSGTPNLSWWNISSSARIDVNRQINSTLTADDLDLVFNPVLTTTPAKLTGFTAVVGGTSAIKSFTVSGVNLKDSVKIVAPAKFQVSTSATTGFKTTLKIPKGANNILPATTIYVRYKPTAIAVDSGEIKITSLGAKQKKVKVYGTCTARLTETVSNIDFEIAPNPVVNTLNIFRSNLTDEKIVVELFDLIGNKMLSKEFAGNDLMNFDISNLKQGVYFCRIQTGGQTVVKRFIKN